MSDLNSIGTRRASSMTMILLVSLSAILSPSQLTGQEQSPRTTHWSFQPLKRPIIPGRTDPWIVHPIDTFIVEQLSKAKLRPSPPASWQTLVRRASLLVLGLPPSQDETAHSNHPAAWPLFVDELLARPQFGERWARHWLDVVRFGETHGYETNRERLHAWPYRDYVINALNRDKPFDQFVREQLAGDASGASVATGFLVAGPYDIVKSPDVKLTLTQRQDELADMINATGTTFLGLTLGCARCHDHKFDPVTQKDYYSMQAIFAGVEHGDRRLPPTSDSRLDHDRIRNQLERARKDLMQFIPATTEPIVVIDDEHLVKSGTRGVEHIREAAGHRENPAGTNRGELDQAVGDNGNISRGRYTWWKNKAESDVVIYRPFVRGVFRVWVSWGCGVSSHTRDAQYWLDADGDVSTRHDQHLIAEIDQQRFANGEAPQHNQTLWSGLKSIADQELTPSTAIVVRAGQTGRAITSDVIVLQNLSGSSSVQLPALYPPVDPARNSEVFDPVATRSVRFTILSSSSGEPCIDELEIFSGTENVGLATRGAVATASGTLPGYKIHKLAHINDGRFGNSYSWISNQPGQGWVQIDLPQTTTVDRIQWGRDREKKYTDRLATRYMIEARTDSGNWVSIASSDRRIPTDQAGEIRYEFAAISKPERMRGKALKRSVEAMQNQLKELGQGALAYAGTFRQPEATKVLYRGDAMAPREQVAPDAIAAMGSLGLAQDEPEQNRRVALADWITRRDNPLVARVIVNRIWQYYFGTGLVATSSDFGAAGSPPSHPELLDWLACELIDNNWSTKSIHRLILTSNTFRQSSRPHAEGIRRDEGVRLLWRFPIRRLEAEAIRDSILSVTGVLDTRMGGKGFDGFEVELENVRHYFPKKTYGPGDWRRMIYMTKVRQEQDSVFGVFDCPDGSQTVPIRSQSTTPLQALNLLNSSFVMQQSELFAQRLERQAGPALESQVSHAYRLCFNRIAQSDEKREAVKFIEDHGFVMFCRALLNSNEFLFIP